MNDIVSENSKRLNAVLGSVEDLHKTETAIKDELNTVVQFIDFLSKNGDEIGKFHAVENEIADYLRNFSFAGKIDFFAARDKLSKLPGLKQKLANMGSEAQKLASMPDRYNCFKAMEVCKNLTLFCVNEMKSVDYDRVTTALDTNIPKLLAIQKEFETEKRIFSDIKNLISKNASIFNKYTAFKMEIEQFLAKFPNNRDTDFQTVEKQIFALNEIDKLYHQIEGLVSQIKNNPDKFQKNATIQQAEQQFIYAKTQMKYGDTNKVKNDFMASISRLKQVVADFDNESKAIAQMYNTIAQMHNVLQQRTPDLWAEESEKLISELDTIRKNSKQSNIDLQLYATRIQKASETKKQNIADFELLYGSWLKRGRNKQKLDSEIRNKYVSFADFKNFISTVEKQRKELMWKIVIAAVVLVLISVSAFILVNKYLLTN